MILADQDERYLRELSHYFMEHVSQFELITFTKQEKLYQYLEQGNTADVLMVDEMLAENRLKDLTSGMTRIAMSVGMSPADGFVLVKKYQRMDTLSDTVLMRYAEDSGSLEAVRGDSDTRIAAFYSPAGGTGKTTLALALAAAGVRAGLRTLYLNLEEIDSVKDILGKTPGSLSDVFLALKTKGMNVGIKLKGSVGTDPAAGFDFLSGVESISEYDEIDGKDVGRLLGAVREVADYDLVVVDQTAAFTDRTREILRQADQILVPVIHSDGNAAKLLRFLEESRLHDAYDSLFRKMHLIDNRAGSGGNGGQLLNAVRNQLPCCAVIMESPVLGSRQNILRSGGELLQMLNPVLQILAGSNGTQPEGRAF